MLVDGNTASAAEILAGALQARGRAKLIGAKTYGKGVVQEWLPLSNNFGGIHLTVARWLTPDKVWIQGKGSQPDVAAIDRRTPGPAPIRSSTPAWSQLGFPPETDGLAQPGAARVPCPSGSPGAESRAQTAQAQSRCGSRRASPRPLCERPTRVAPFRPASDTMPRERKEVMCSVKDLPMRCTTSSGADL